MGILLNLLAFPLLGGPITVHWLAGTIVEQAQRELLDEGPVRGALLELQQQYDAGQLDESDYDRQEGELLERLKAIRDFKAQINEQPAG